ncbi:MAG: ABC transporter permease [Candidatus Limiplasma sp.]|nr:ABC transporter permease [Candidatus Limiplasma sp.]
MVNTQRGRGALTRKLFRDMHRSAMQFVAIVLLCALGTWVFSGLEGTWRMLEVSAETYFAQANLADFWINLPGATKADVDNVRNQPGVLDVQSRYTAEFDTPDYGEDASLKVLAYADAARINVPLVRTGAALTQDDLRGILLDEEFAKAHGIRVGDTLKLRQNTLTRVFTVRALVLSAEQVITAKDVMPDPLAYGYAIVNKAALNGFPVNELIVTLQPGVDAAQAEARIQALLPQALIITQETHPVVQRMRSEVTMFRNMTYVFPVLAFAVAAMIVLTTLTRMIENQRSQIGTLKALGYGPNRIRTHYVNYAFVPSLGGALLGQLVGHYTLPDMLYAMEVNHFIIPERIRPPIAFTEWGMTALMVALSIFICLAAYRRAEKEEAAALLRPKPPKAGSRVLLERWKGFWGKLNFNTKMIVRGVARNKGRTAVAMVGLLCCNALIICAMGLQDSMQASVGDYYRGTVGYSLRADLDTDAGTLESYQNRVDAQAVEGVMETQVSLRYAGGSRAVLMSVLSDGQQLMRLGANNALIALPTDGIAISRKLSEVTGLATGDSVAIWLPGDDTGIPMTIRAVYPVNIGQTVYMGKAVWDGLRKGAFTPTGLLLESPTALAVHQLEQAREVAAFKDPEAQYTLTMSVLDSTTAVFSLMYAAALGLAFVICYNMGLINFTERTRDYATLKVLGYHQKEIRGLMMWENNIVTLIGAGLGIVPGILLTRVVLDAIGSESTVFIANVTFVTILTATAITSVFSVLIEWMITRKVRTLDMVEALKSVE